MFAVPKGVVVSFVPYPLTSFFLSSRHLSIFPPHLIPIYAYAFVALQKIRAVLECSVNKQKTNIQDLSQMYSLAAFVYSLMVCPALCYCCHHCCTGWGSTLKDGALSLLEVQQQQRRS